MDKDCHGFDETFAFTCFECGNNNAYEDDGPYFDMDLALPINRNNPLEAKEFEFCISISSAAKTHVSEHIDDVSPADDLFYKGQLLPLHLPPRLQMVRNLSLSKEIEDGSHGSAVYIPVSHSLSSDMSGETENISSVSGSSEASRDSNRSSVDSGCISSSAERQLPRKTHFLRKSATKLKVSLFGFRKSSKVGMDELQSCSAHKYNPASLGSHPPLQKQRKFTVKFKSIKAPSVPFFTKDYSSRSKKKPDYANGRSSSNNRSTAKEVVQKYLKPIYYKISQKHDHYGQSSFLEQQLGMDDEFEWPCIVDESSRLNQFSNFSGNLSYDAFDFDPFSKYCGSCKYHRRRYFENVGMSDYGYEITRYLYATSNINLSKFFRKSRSPKMWSSHANWMGVVAVTTDEKEIERLGRRDIVVAWRGTVTYLEWIADLMDFLKPAGLNVIDPDPDVKVESGFLNLYTAKESDCRFCKASAREQIHTEIKRLVDKYKGEELSITITGHSLGSALAMLSAYDLAETGINVRSTSDVNVRDKEASKIPITVFSFAGPRVGNSRFKERCEELGLKILRVVNVHDSVPKVPGILFNEKFQMLREWIDKLPWSYSHVGVELALDHKHSPFLKPNADPSCYHNLEAHLHMLDGYHGRGRRFFLASGRDPALVNKACDFLKDHHLVPPHWRQDENKGLLKNHEGRWIQPERSRVDEVPSDTLHMTTPNVGAHPPKKSSVQS